ncbi:MAG: hypothetical protein LBC59_07810 [Chitinispirillales bacterium]|jgi:hypothetical protein|nr:hypothetical protein [Chitinispirillales bacterium]
MNSGRGVRWALLVVTAAIMVGLGVIEPRNKLVRMPSRFNPYQAEMCEREHDSTQVLPESESVASIQGNT